MHESATARRGKRLEVLDPQELELQVFVGRRHVCREPITDPLRE